MFHSARLQLTAWYLLIIMIISSLFSLVIYSSINVELKRFEDFQRSRQARVDHMMKSLDLPRSEEPMFSTEEIEHARGRVILTLVVINGMILAISGVAGYFLAGRTLRPIQEMVDEQKRFITDASHELRTPLTALRSEIEVHLRDKALSLPDAKRLLKSNLEEVILLQNLSDGLLTLTRQQRTTKKHFHAISLGRVLDQAVKKVTPLATKKSIVIKTVKTDEEIWGDLESLKEVFVILLDNAIKYSADKTNILITMKRVGPEMRVQVTDEGMGIAKKDLPHIFERFYRADTARTKEDASGYGLGLSIAQKVVNDHSGEISVTSVLGRGTTFVVRLPRGKRVGL